MQRGKRAVARLGVLVAAALLMGPAAAATDYKIGYVNVQRVVQQSEEAQKAKGQLKKEVKERKAELEGKRKKVNELQKKLEKQGSLMSEEQKKKTQRQLEEATREFRRLQRKAQQDLDTQKNQVLQDIYDDVSQIVSRIGEEEDYDLILTGSSAIYVSEPINLTEQVLTELNNSQGDG